MKDLFLICMAVTIVSSFISIILDVMGASKSGKIVRFCAYMIIALLFISNLNGEGLPTVSINATETDYKNINADYLKKVYVEAEESIEMQISQDIYEKFGVKPKLCKVKIDSEKLAFESIKIVFLNYTDKVSGYGIRTFIFEKYKILPEVIFE